MRLNKLQIAVLEAVRELEPNAYGVNILVKVGAEFRFLSYNALYTAIDRLESEGLIEAWRGDPTPERGDRPKRFVRLTEGGLRELHSQRLGDEVVLA